MTRDTFKAKGAPVGVEELIVDWESDLAEDKRDGVAEVAIRVQEIRLDQLRALAQQPAAHPAITHCDNCGCDWLDNGLNPIGCPYCKQNAWRAAYVAERATRYREGGMKIEQARIHAETDNAQGWATGLTKREMFAAMAMQGFAAAAPHSFATMNDAVEAAVTWADLLLAELAKEGAA